KDDDVGYPYCDTRFGRILESKVFHKVQHYGCFCNVELVEYFGNDLAEEFLVERLADRRLFKPGPQSFFTKFGCPDEVFVRCLELQVLPCRFVYIREGRWHDLVEDDFTR